MPIASAQVGHQSAEAPASALWCAQVEARAARAAIPDYGVGVSGGAAVATCGNTVADGGTGVSVGGTGGSGGGPGGAGGGAGGGGGGTGGGVGGRAGGGG